MANLAIKGHATRGKEIIEILKMLGGDNSHNYIANCESLYFYIGDDTKIIYYDWICSLEYQDMYLLTIEEFIEKFPYKVGDKAFAFGNKCTIIDAVWDEGIDEVVYTIKLDTSKYTTTKLSNQLQPCKEQTMKEIIKIDIPKGYEFFGVDDDNQQVVFEKIGCQYPKTFEECCNVLLLKPERATYSVSGLEYERHLIVNFQRLLICRDAYWKIAGWKPSADDEGTTFSLFYNRHVDCIEKFSGIYETNAILDFPTKEMCEAFYENFKDLIEYCKWLL